jgi:hypothetical protein
MHIAEVLSVCVVPERIALTRLLRRFGTDSGTPSFFAKFL